MYDFFVNNSLCLGAYLFAVVLLMFARYLPKYKKYLLLAGLAVFVIDISFLLVLGFSLQRCAIVTGICLILALISMKEGETYEL